MKRNYLAGIVCVAMIGFSATAFADESEKETPQEEQEAKARELETPEAVKIYYAYLEDLDRRYPDSAEVNVDRFMVEEGELAALTYCNAIGIDGPCTIEGEGEEARFVPLGSTAASATRGSRWWDWLLNHLFNVGVIPEQNACPAPYIWTQIYMDDEDRRNANSRWGWQGATVSTNNTTWRFCKLDTITSLAFRPLPLAGNQHDYAVLNMGLFCPSGARRVIRRQDNEDWNNQNSSIGSVFPSFNLWPGNWHTFTCHFDGAAPSVLGQMTAFPNIGIKYGVFGQNNMPGPYALQHGYIYQDDEDFLNTNFWIGSPDTAMGGSNNTWRGLVKVK